MATTVAQPGTTLRRVAKEYADQAGMPVGQFLEKLQRLNPDYNRSQGSDALRLGRGVSPAQGAGGPIDDIKLGSPANTDPEGQVFPEGDAPAQNAGGFQLANILESPLYTQNLKDYYLSQYLPGLTQATFNINQAQTQFGSNEADRARQRGEAIKRVAGSYAARGMRSPAAINRDRSEIQSEFAKLSRAEQGGIQSLMSERDALFGAGAKDSENFLSDPTLFGSIGAGARRQSLSNLQDMPQLYNLLGLGASTAPMVQMPAEPAAESRPALPSLPAAKPKPKPPAPKPITPPGNITPYKVPKKAAKIPGRY